MLLLGYGRMKPLPSELVQQETLIKLLMLNEFGALLELLVEQHAHGTQ